MRHVRDFLLAMSLTVTLTMLLYSVLDDTLRPPTTATATIWPVQLVYIAR